ncbi:MAG: FMN-binding protein [Rectinemataceae bacterium]
MKMRKIVLIPLLVLGVFLVFGIGFFMSFGIPKRDLSVKPLTASGLPDGNYVGQGAVTPPFGTFAVFRKVEVSIDIADGMITTADFLKPASKDEPFATLTANILRAQGTGIDAVSGGSWTSLATAKAVEDALSKAGAHQ